MPTEVEQLIIQRLDSGLRRFDKLDRTVGKLDERLDQLALSVEHRVTTLEVTASSKGRRAGAVSAAVIVLVTAVAGFLAAIARGMF